MGILKFWKKRTKKVKRQPTTEQVSRNAELKRQRFVSESYIELAKQDPELKRQMIAEEYKLKLPTKDPAAEQRKAMEELISSLVVKELREHPELARQVVDARIAQLTSQEDLMTYGDNQEHYPSTAIGQVLVEMEDLEELKSRLGAGKSSTLSDLFHDPQVISSLLSAFQSIMRGESPQVTEPLIMVQIDGRPTTVTETEYKKLQQEGRAKPVAIVESPEPSRELRAHETTSELTAQDESTESIRDRVAEEIVPPTSDEPQLPPIFHLVDLAELSGYLEQSPAEAVKQLEAKKLEGLPYAQVLWNYLETVDCGSLTQVLVVYEGHGELGPFVRKLLSSEGRTWLAEVIELIK